MPSAIASGLSEQKKAIKDADRTLHIHSRGM
jgi:hypothetical protein